MGKVIVSKGVAEAVDLLLKKYGLDSDYDMTNDELLETHIKKDFPWSNDNPVNGLTGIELANILINGYEVELTPEERVTEEVRRLYKELNAADTQWKIKAIEREINGLRVAYQIFTGKGVIL